MKKVLAIVFILCAGGLFAQEMGVGLDIRVFHDSDTVDNGSGEIESYENSMEFGGSFHYFENETREYSGSLAIGTKGMSNGTSETTQSFVRLGGGVRFHILKGSMLNAGIGGTLGITGFFEPVVKPSVQDYDHYSAGEFSLGIPVFADVALHKNWLLRFEAITAALMYDYEAEDIGGVKESRTSLDLYTTVTSDTSNRNWFPVTISFIFKF